MKRCNGCGKRKPLSEFYGPYDGKGYSSRCTVCHVKGMQKYHRTPERLAEGRRRLAAYQAKTGGRHRTDSGWKKRLWTQEEVEYLLANFEFKTTMEMALHLGRTFRATQVKLDRLRAKVS